MSRPVLGIVVATVLVAAGVATFVLFFQEDVTDQAGPARGTAAETAIVDFAPGPNPRNAIGHIHEAARQNHDALRLVALKEVSSVDSDERWAAVYALSIVIQPGDAEGISTLERLLASDDLDERLASADGLGAVGEKSGIPVLIALLDSEETTDYVVIPVWRVARGLLLARVDQDLGLVNAADGRAARSVRPAWESWWAERGSSVEWDPATGRFR
ncbi:MAG: HEAT repeat domain-containing protein [Dehalococcoidia bacterium]|nr:HEAT repeat domain-containing protein [Dehalococcoidia bacterium]